MANILKRVGIIAVVLGSTSVTQGREFSQRRAYSESSVRRSSVVLSGLRASGDGYYFGLHNQIVKFTDCFKLVTSLSEFMIKPLDEKKFYRDYVIGCVPYDEEQSYIIYQVAVESLAPAHEASLRDIIGGLTGKDVFGVKIEFHHAVGTEEESAAVVVAEKGGREIEIYRSETVARGYTSYLSFIRALESENRVFRGPDWSPVLPSQYPSGSHTIPANF